jgi:hypothetical protein
LAALMFGWLSLLPVALLAACENAMFALDANEKNSDMPKKITKTVIVFSNLGFIILLFYGIVI